MGLKFRKALGGVGSDVACVPAELPDWAEEVEGEEDSADSDSPTEDAVFSSVERRPLGENGSKAKKGVSVEELRFTREQKEKMRKSQLEQQQRKLTPEKNRRTLTPKQKEVKLLTLCARGKAPGRDLFLSSDWGAV